MKTALIADDRTSAMDGGIQFTRAGLTAAVALSVSHLKEMAAWPVLCVDADSRARHPAEAAESIAQCVRALCGRQLLMKTVDSTIRGHLAAEIRAAQRAGERTCTVVAPAFPALARTTRGGRQYFNNIPLSATEFSRDPYHPVTDDDICSILERGGVRDVRLLHRSELSDRRTIAAAIAPGACVVVDADTDDDLHALVSSVAAPEEILWVGSPGLARTLGRAFGENFALVDQIQSPRILVAVGSLNRVSRRQLLALRGQAQTAFIEVDAHLALEDPATAASAALETTAALPHEISAKKTVIVASSEVPSGTRVCPAASSSVMNAMACAVETLQRLQPFDGFILTGGDTAAHMAHRLRVTGIKLECEFAPGVAVGTFMGPISSRVLTKAGGFGDDLTLVAACDFLRGGKPQAPAEPRS